MSELIQFVQKCNYCRKTVKQISYENNTDEILFYKHEKYGNVCEFCGPFSDGGIERKDNRDKDNSLQD